MQTYDTCRAGAIQSVRVGHAVVARDNTRHGDRNYDANNSPDSRRALTDANTNRDLTDAERRDLDANPRGGSDNADRTNTLKAKRKSLDETDTSRFNDT